MDQHLIREIQQLKHEVKQLKESTYTLEQLSWISDQFNDRLVALEQAVLPASSDPAITQRETPQERDAALSQNPEV